MVTLIQRRLKLHKQWQHFEYSFENMMWKKNDNTRLKSELKLSGLKNAPQLKMLNDVELYLFLLFLSFSLQ